MYVCNYAYFLQTWDYFYAEHVRRFKSEISKTSSPHTDAAAYTFDAIWAAALAVNKTYSLLKDRNLTFMNFSYDKPAGKEISDHIYNEALKVNFFGVTVSV